jgi:hypothetical protein
MTDVGRTGDAELDDVLARCENVLHQIERIRGSLEDAGVTSPDKFFRSAQTEIWRGVKALKP